MDGFPYVSGKLVRDCPKGHPSLLRAPHGKKPPSKESHGENCLQDKNNSREEGKLKATPFPHQCPLLAFF